MLNPSNLNIPARQDNRTLLQIFNAISSPLSSSTHESLLDDAYRILNGAPVPGITARLHQYQRHSVAAMLQRELRLRRPNPSYLPLHKRNGALAYLEPASMQLVDEVPTVPPAPGGILCEEMGRVNLIRFFDPGLTYIHHTRDREDGHDLSVDLFHTA